MKRPVSVYRDEQPVSEHAQVRRCGWLERPYRYFERPDLKFSITQMVTAGKNKVGANFSMSSLDTRVRKRTPATARTIPHVFTSKEN